MPGLVKQRSSANNGILDNVYEPKPVVPEYPPDLHTIFRLHARSGVRAEILASDAARGTEDGE